MRLSRRAALFGGAAAVAVAATPGAFAVAKVVAPPPSKEELLRLFQERLEMVYRALADAIQENLYADGSGQSDDGLARLISS